MRRGFPPALWAAAGLIGATVACAAAGRVPAAARAVRRFEIGQGDLPHARGDRWTYAGQWRETLTGEAPEGPRSTTGSKRGTEVVKVGGEDRATFSVPTIVHESTFTEKPSGGPPQTFTWQSYSRRVPEGVLAYGYKYGSKSGALSGKLARNPKPALTFKLPLARGARWAVGTVRGADGLEMTLTAQVSGPETVRVPAGTFRNCLKVIYRCHDLRGTASVPAARMEVNGGSGVETVWIAPGVGTVKEVKLVQRHVIFYPTNGSTPVPGTSESRSTRELTSFHVTGRRGG